MPLTDKYIFGEAEGPADAGIPDPLTNIKLNRNTFHLSERIDAEAEMARQFGENPATTAGLVWGYFGGIVPGDGETPVRVDGGTVELTLSETNYVTVNEETGDVNVSTSGWTPGERRLREITTDIATITESLDWRSWTQLGPAGPAGADGTDGSDGADGVGVPAGGTTGQILKKSSGTDFDTEWADETGGGGGDMLAANNLSDLTDVADARDNLGLGDSATLDVGTGAGTVAAGDDARLSDSRTPTGSAGGDLTGTYPNPSLTNTGVTADEYERVTVNAKGRVTAGGKGAFAYNASTTTGLTFGYYQGRVGTDNGSVSTVVNIAGGTVALTDNAVNYVEADPSGSGSVVVNTTGWTAGLFPLHKVTTVAGDITLVEAFGRSFTRYSGGGGGGGGDFLADGSVPMTGNLDLDGNSAENAASVVFSEGTAPSTPASGKVAIYAKGDGKVYSKDDTGTETELGGGGGGGGGSYTVDTAPDPTTRAGQTIYVSDGANGLPCGALSDGTDWLRLVLGAPILGNDFPLSGLLIYLRGDTPGTGTAWTDQSGTGYTTTISGATWDAVNGALSFTDGSHDAVITDGWLGLFSGRSTWSIEFKVLWSGFPGILMRGDIDHYVGALAGGGVRSAMDGVSVNSSTPVSTGTVYSVCVQRDASTTTIYVDNVSVGSASSGSTPTGSGDLYIANYSGFEFLGKIFRFAVWNRLLTSDERAYLAST